MAADLASEFANKAKKSQNQQFRPLGVKNMNFCNEIQKQQIELYLLVCYTLYNFFDLQTPKMGIY